MAKVVPHVPALLLACVAALLVAATVGTARAEAAISAQLRSPTVTIAAGGGHTLALRSNGRLQSWGSNTSGQLGDGTTTQRLTPTWVGTDTDWVAVACGANHTVALKANGSLYAWGQNVDGQLGLNDTNSRKAPTRVGTATDWVAVACGSFHTVALKADGSLWVWGDNTYGQLGLDDTTDRTTPQTLGGVNWSFVAAGGWHTLALKSTGQLYAWGRNDYGQLGDGAGVEWHHPIRMTDYTDWVAVAGGAYHSAGLRAAGSLYTWGRNDYGQLGLGNTTNVNVPTRVGSANDWVGVACGFQHTLGLKANATAYGWGFNDYGQVGDASTTSRALPVQIGAGTTWSSLAAGGNHSVGRAGDGGVSAWGHNASGQVGDGSTTNRTSPVSVLAVGCVWAAPRAHRGETDRTAAGLYHTLSVKPDGSLWAWGEGGSGQIGDGALSDRPSPVQVGPSFVWRTVAAGSTSSHALRHDGSLYAWGENGYGQLGLGDTSDRTSPQRVGAANDWVAVAAGRNHVLALKANGTLWAWGYNLNGELGIGTQVSVSTPTQVGTAGDWVAIGAGGYSSYGVRASGGLYAWGLNDYGQLGLADQVLRTSPVRVGSGNTWAAVSGGDFHALGLTISGGAFAWGYNLYGQVGAGETSVVNTPTALAPATGWVALCGGGNHSHGVRSDGALCGWGLNDAGQLGDSTLVDRTTPITIGNGYVTACGGSRHALFEKAGGDLYASGGNEWGQLGWGTVGDTAVPTFVMRPSDRVAPTVSGLTSTSHPVQTNWYSDATADLQWTAADDQGVYGLWFGMAAAPLTNDGWIKLPAGTSAATAAPLVDGIWYYSMQARDLGASWSAPAVREIRVDTTAPSAVPAFWSPSHPVWNAWYTDDTPTLAWETANDATSGIAGYSWVATQGGGPDTTVDGTGTTVTLGPLADGRWSCGVRAVDLAGNAGSTEWISWVSIDTTAPVTTDDANPTWMRDADTVNLLATDASSGVWRTYVQVDGGGYEPGTSVTLRTGKHGRNSGEHVIDYYSVDYCFNEESPQSCYILLDSKPPRTSWVSPREPALAPVAVLLRASDADSGVYETRYALNGSDVWTPGDTIRIDDPGTYTLRYYSLDYAGNEEPPRQVTFTVLGPVSPRDRQTRPVRLR